MKVVAGVDWSDAAFAAVEQLGLLYRPGEIALVHGVDLGLFEYPIVAEAANLQGYDIFRKSMFEAGCESLERAEAMLPADVPKPRRLCDFAKPARFLLDTAASMSADLIVVGTHDHSRVAELVLTSVSHRVLLHATQPTLLVKGQAKPVRRILIAIEGRTDAAKISDWLIRHPFRTPMEAVVLTAMPMLPVLEQSPAAAYTSWSEEVTRQAEAFVRSCAAQLAPPQFTSSSRVIKGDPVTVISDAAKDFDLVVMGSHGREGLDRFLLGSVSHAIVHHVSSPVLLIR
ncbi:MAG TPA: universal stress protein [Nitrospira sp.]|nr:universal stress protein [Nitrospira sp.]